ncbi:MAG: amino acid adenylation domain-containing protein [Halanaerobiales bacterium]|nr:amino acid adenylation domain-containing protein [Halanaerobiales bacterium]
MKRKVEIEKLYSLSPMQEGMLYHSLLNKDSNAYFEQSVFTITGDIDRELLEKSLNLLIEKHESLRTVFVHEKVAKPKQVVLKNVEGKIDFEDISYLDAVSQEKYLEEYKVQDRDKGFVLTKHLLMRVTLFKTGKESYKLIWSFPHIIMDGWCLGIIFKDLIEIYSSLRKNDTVEITSITPYIDYIKWLEKQNQKAGLEYWENYLSGYDTQATLPNLGSPVSDQYQVSEYEFTINEKFTHDLMTVAKENQVTINNLMQTAWGVLLQKYNNTDDVVFGAVVSGRPSEIAGIAEVVGLFINTVPVRISVGENNNFAKLLKSVQIKSVSAKQFEYLPLADIQSSSSLKNNLIDHLMVFENYPIEEGIKDVSSVDELGFRVVDVEFFEQTNYDFNIIIFPEKTLTINFNYNTAVYDGDFVKKIGLHFTQILNQIVENPKINLSEIEVITEEEKSQLLYDFNDTQTEYPNDQTLHQLFEEQAKKTPDNIAVIFDDQTLTYSELNKRANQLASILRSKGVGTDSIVGLVVERSFEMIIGIYAILKSGGAYLPLSPDYPKERIDYILTNSEAKLLLTQERFLDLCNDSCEVINLEDANSYGKKSDDLENINSPRDLAYVIYTSGSTGKPKGVMIEHHSAINRLKWMQAKYPITENDLILQKTPFTFDVSVWELFWWALEGAKVCLLVPDGEKDPATIVETIEKEEVTVIHFVPSMLNAFLEYVGEQKSSVRLKSLQKVFTSGEELKVHHVERFMTLLAKVNDTKLANLYGPTEATVDVTYFDCNSEKNYKNIPIGKPIHNIKLYILDQSNHLAPVGTAGELCISGLGLARGYLNRPDLTEERFIPNPFVEGERIYRTGDLSRWLPDGNIEFLGRIDFQVKIRGFRIELGEIDNSLLKIEYIKEALVIDREDVAGEKYLCAYIVSDDEVDTPKVRMILAKSLPDYMIPVHFVQLERIPLTLSGKANRKALPAPEVKITEEYIAPRTELEESLVKIWSEVLRIDQANIGIDANFFEIGGHSLKAIQVIGKIQKQLKVAVTIPIFFEASTIRKLAVIIDGAEKTKFVDLEKVEEKDIYELSYNQKRLWLINQLDPDSPAYNLSEKIELKEDVDQEIVKKALSKIIERHESFRTGFKNFSGEPVQFVNEKVELPFEYIDISRLDEVKKIKSDEIFAKVAKTIFDLAKAPLFKVVLVKLAENRYDLIYNMHHIISDGWSMQILQREFGQIYEGYKDSNEVQLQRVEYQYKDFAEWHNKQISNPLIKEKSHKYWENKLKAGYPELELPRDFAHMSKIKANQKSSSYKAVVKSDVKELLKKLAKDHNTSLFMVMFSAVNLLFSRLTNQKEIVIGVAGAGREHISLQNIIGYFINSILLKNHVEYDENFTDLLQRIDKETLEAFQHQSYPLELVLDDLKMRFPEVSVFFNMLNMMETATENELKSFAGEHIENVQDVKFDLEFYVVEYKNGIEIYWNYKNSLFLPETIEYFANEYLKVLGEIATTPAKKIKEYNIFSSKFEKLENSINPTNSFIEFKKEEINQSIVSRFEKQVELYNSRIAVKTEKQSLTYQELNDTANQIARSIRKVSEAKPEGIAILFEHDVDMISGIFGTLKSGNYYIPLDPTYPIKRLVYMFEDSNAKILLTNDKNKSLAESLTKELGRGIKIVNIEEIDPAVSKKNINHTIDPDSISYILYTSGSTGKPKGVIQKHKNVLHFIEVYTNNLHISSDDRLTLLSSYSFDAAVMDIYGALLNGAALYLYDLKKSGDLIQLSNWLRDEKITIYHSIPTVYRYFTDELTEDDEFPELRLIVLGGEAVYKRDVERYKRYFKDDCLFVNGLGPTESTVTLQYFIDKETEVLKEAVPVGFPVDETEVFLIDDNNEEVGVFCIGEIVYKSDYLSPGYLNNPEKTAEVFVNDSLSNEGRVYRSGDLGRRLIDGSIEFIGRGDAQVKIRGYRIELGEIENKLITYPDVKEAVVLAKEDGNGTKYLCGYYVSKEEIQASELREFLAKELPDYMIPVYYVRMNEFPVTQSGKINRRVLPEPDFVVVGVEYIAPRNETEKILANIWANVLGIEAEKIGVNNNFFELGGHSLKATQLISKIYKEFDVKVPLPEIFKNSTVSGIAKYLEVAKKESYTAIEVAKEMEYYSLSSAQKRLFILQKLETGYNIPTVALLEGEIEIAKLEAVFRKLINRHESLRTSFEMVDRQAVQKINDLSLDFAIEYFESIKVEADEIITNFIRPFDIEKAPLFRVGLIKVAENEHLLIVDIHHIISDGTSIGIFVKDFMSLYSGEELPELRIQYKDYAEWQNTEQSNALIKKQEEYWLKEFSGQIPVIDLPIDYQRPTVQSFAGNRNLFEIGHKETEGLKKLARNENATLYMVLLAVYNVLLAKLSGQDDIIVGTPIAGRRHPDLQSIIGVFINTLVLRNKPTADKRFTDFLGEVSNQTLQAFENQEYPFEGLVQKANVARDVSRNPLFDVFFALQNMDMPEVEIPGLKLKPYDFESEVSKFDLSFYGVEIDDVDGNSLRFTVEYSTKLFKEETIQRFIGYFMKIVSAVLEESENKLADIEILTESEKTQILYDFNDTALEYSKDKTIHQIFEEQVEKTPDLKTLVYGDKCLTYRELNNKSNQLANLLRSKGVAKDSLVGIMLTRSIEMMVGILGILKAGGVYLPIDPSYPDDRVKYMLEDSNAAILLIEKGLLDQLNSIQFTGEIIDVTDESIEKFADANLANIASPDNLAYVIYTSGSTGKPKGVMIEHQNVVNFIKAIISKIEFAAEKKILALTTISFDIFVLETLVPLASGLAVVIADENHQNDLSLLKNIIIESEVDMVQVTPSRLTLLMEGNDQTWLKGIKVLMVGGEAFPDQLLKKVQSQFAGKIYNLYGPTETTVWSAIKDVTKADKVTIGTPIANTQIYILDRSGHIQPVGVAGELCIGGDGVTRGYLNTPDLTEEKFIANPYQDGKRIYRTGDLVRWLSNGEIEFLGRIDNQVKIRGYRIELGEIESRLLAHDEIMEIVVTAVETKKSVKSLAAYFVSKTELTVTKLRAYLSDELPAYMIPAYFVQLDEMPLTPNGKIDRKQLPELEVNRPKLGTTFVAPKNNLEQMIADIWKNVLTVNEVGVDDNFFDLGGNSFDLIQVNTELKEVIDKDVSVVTMFRYPTIRSFAKYLHTSDDSASIQSISDQKNRNDAINEGKDRLRELRESEEKSDGRTGFEIAVIGIAGRFPGAKNVDEFWANLKNGVESITFFTDEELEEAGIEPELIQNPNYIKAKGVLEDIEYFDPLFFDYSPREVEMMDPQFRLLHVCAWEALENAGYNADTYAGSIGVYAGSSPNHAWMARAYSRIQNPADQYVVATLNGRDFLSTRISYKLNLQGPAFTVQAACSTSLVAIDLACQNLLSGKCDMALTGGVSLSLPKKSGYIYQEGMIKSPDGHCRAFDAEAKGTIFGDGVGIAVLKRLDDAIKDGDYIHAVIKGSAINNDGVRKVGFTAPSVEGQAEVIKAAQHMAEVDSASISYIETHGTATTLGDPIEVEALKLAFDSEKRNYCGIGSVKTNVGHLNIAAGIAGFIKTVLALEYKFIPPSLHFKSPNPKIDFDNSPFYVNTELKEWKNGKYPLRAGVSSFGIGGTNAHIILEEAPEMKDSLETRPYKLIMLSAKSASSLERTTDNLIDYLKKNPESNLADVAYTLQVGRKPFKNRRMMIVRDVDELIDGLSSLDSKKVFTSSVGKNHRPVFFMFSGQGSQYMNMGLELYQNELAFREVVDECLGILQPLIDEDLKEILYPENVNSKNVEELKNKINQTYLTQPLIFTFEYALAKLLLRWGIKPDAMIGHSIGEYVAACLSGVFSLEDALTLVTLRGRLMNKMPHGSMLSVPVSHEELEQILTEEISIAAVNTPASTVLSGTDEAIDQFARVLEEKGYQSRRLHTSHAFHSMMMDPILERFRDKMEEIALNKPEIPYISNVSGNWITVEEAMDPDYWVKHLRGTVRFADGMREMFKVGNGVFVEAGPGQTLSTLARQHPDKTRQHLVLNLVRHPKENESDLSFLLNRLGRLWLNGIDINWSEFYANEERHRIPLPTYPFERLYFDIDITGQSLIATKKSGEEAKSSYPETILYSRGELPDDYVAPRNEVEEKIIEVFGGVLGINQISIHENFFELGGDSLKSVSVAAKIHQELNVEIPLSELFKRPTAAELAEFINDAGENLYTSIEPTSKKEYYRLSSAQKRLYLTQQMNKDTLSYNMPFINILTGKLDQEKLAETFKHLIKRHESFRTSFIVVDGEPVQKIIEKVEFAIEYFNANEEEAKEIINSFIRPFNLEKAPLLRVGLIRISKDRHILMLDMHHIISDGTSQGILLKEFMCLYGEDELAELKLQYKDYSEWQNMQLENDAMKKQEEYWLNEFAGDIPKLNLLTDYPRPTVQSFRGNSISFELGREDTERLKELIIEEKTTLFMLLLTIYNVFLAKLSGDEEIVIGTVTDGRQHYDLKPIIGMFVNTLAMKNVPSKEKTFKEFLREVTNRTLQTFENQDYQFEDLVRKVVVNREPGRSPIFDVMFLLQNMDIPEIELPGLKLQTYDWESLISRFDLTLYATETTDSINCAFVYSTELFKEETIELMKERFIILLRSILDNTDYRIEDLEYRTSLEQELSDVIDLDFDF